MCAMLLKIFLEELNVTPRPSKNFQPPGLLLVVKGPKFQTLGGFRYTLDTVYLSIYLSICLSVCLSVCLSIYIYIYIYPSISYL